MANVLIIEDNEGVLKAYARALRDHTLTMVKSGVEALGLLEGGLFDSIISDYDIEGRLSGGDVFRWVQLNRPELVSKYAFCSHNEDAAQLCAEAGIMYYDKPVRCRELLKFIEERVGVCSS